MSYNFSINHKKFTGEYYNQITKGIHRRYKKVYPDSTIDVEYKRSCGEYKFFVFVTLPVINGEGLAKERTLIKSYNNFDAITYFSSIPLDDYLKQYDDSKNDYLNKFIDEANAIILNYTLAGMDIEPIVYKPDITQYVITIKDLGWIGKTYIFGHTRYKGMMTEEEYKSHLRHVKTKLKENYEKWQQRQ